MATRVRNRMMRSWPIAVVLLAALLIASGCGSPRARYKVLSFFFDGVPNPDAPANAGRASIRTAGGREVYVHKPYAEEKCDACHQNTADIFARAQVSPQACLKCHDTILKAYPYMHGPVASAYCLKCHEGHQSDYKHLLKVGGSKLCTQCHSMPDLSRKVPEHGDAQISCMTCHSGHGGQTHKLLKVSAVPATAPATNEVPQ